MSACATCEVEALWALLGSFSLLYKIKLSVNEKNDSVNSK
jgi:hypothetical protein